MPTKSVQNWSLGEITMIRKADVFYGFEHNKSISQDFVLAARFVKERVGFKESGISPKAEM